MRARSSAVACNHTPWRVVVKARSGLDFELAPFEDRPLDDLVDESAFIQLVAGRQVSIEKLAQHATRTALAGIVLLALLLLAVWTLLELALWRSYGVFLGGAIPIGLVALAACVYETVHAVHHMIGSKRDALANDPHAGDPWTKWHWIGWAIEGVAGRVYNGAPVVVGWLGQVATMALVAAFALVVPALVLFYGTDLHDKVHIVRDLPPLTGTVDGEVTARILQLGIIIFAALLPALMYFLFDRTRLDALRDRWRRQIFRLDPSLATEADLHAKYGRRIGEVSSRVDGIFSGLGPARRSPIVVATVLLALGWCLVLVNPGGSSTFDILRVLDPNNSALVMGFLGAYFFAVQLTLRGYIRGDLQPKTYSTITVRVVSVVILAWVLQAIIMGDPRPSTGGGSRFVVEAMAFTAGFFPDVAVRKVFEVARFVIRDRDMDGGGPLTDLDGIDLYDRTRLAEEGIVNIEALARHGPVDLMLRTRIPMGRLVDWIDQAILYLHVIGRGGCDNGMLANLRAGGVRTATDLLNVVEDARARRGERTAILSALTGDPAGSVDARIKVLVAAMHHEEWLVLLRNWRNSVFADPELARRYWIGPTGELHRPTGAAPTGVPPAPGRNGTAAAAGVAAGAETGTEVSQPRAAAS